jgi:exo-1,4-beta-D-glucosaminidase
VAGAGRAAWKLRVGARTAIAAALLAALAGTLPAGAGAHTLTLGLGGWQVQSSALVPAAGTQVSQAGFPTASWLGVKPDDGGAPGTEISALLENGACPEVFVSEEMKSCFGFTETIGPVTVQQFSVPWWFRTQFEADLQVGEHAQLIVNGVVGQAELWVNGHELAGSQPGGPRQEPLQGDYTRYAFDITELVHPGANALALEVYPNDPTSMFTLDDVDWNQIPPDNNTGIQFPLQLHTSGALSLEDAHALQDDAPDLSSAALTLKGRVRNNTPDTETGTVRATVAPPGGGEAIAVSKNVTVPAQASVEVSFAAAEDPQLRIVKPQVWWPYQMGAQPLYRLSMEVLQPGGPPDLQSLSFGIRTIGTHLLGQSKIAPHGVRQFAVNGTPIVLRAGGFAEDLFLRYSAVNTTQQIALIKNLGLNAIRTEGKEMPEDFYEQMDRAGILIDAGFQCCDAWQPEHAKLSHQDYRVLGLSALAIGRQLRDHPSVLDFSWSDNTPTRKQEQVSLKGFAEADFQDPLIASAEYKRTAGLGPSGEKEGPYDWVPPNYWYDNTHFDPRDPTRTNVGGAWGFDSEASAGDTVPTLDSIERFTSPFEQEQLWKDPSYNQYHTNYEPELPGPRNGGYSFGTLFELDKAIAARFGAPSSLDEYVEDAQVQNYETQRAQFEAYIDHADTAPTPSTGVVYWQLNKGWPSLLWDLYNWEFDQAGSYFGAKQANENVHALYAYDTHSVTVDNLTGATQAGLTVQAKVYALDGQLLDQQSAGPIALPAQGLATDLLTPKVPSATTPPAGAETYFVELLVSRSGTLIDRNVYWLSTQQDVLDWGAMLHTGEVEPHATMSQYSDLRGLHELPNATIQVSAHTGAAEGPAGSDRLTTVTVTNTSTRPTVAFFLRADVRRGASGKPAGGASSSPSGDASSSEMDAEMDDEVLPVFWSTNDTTLWPGESESMSAAYSASALQGRQPVVSVSGWNVPTVDVPAP